MRQIDPRVQKLEEAKSLLHKRIHPYLRSKAQRTRHVTADVARWDDFNKAAKLLDDLYREMTDR